MHTHTHTHAVPRSDPSPEEGISTYLRCLQTTASCSTSSCPSALGGPSSLPPSAWSCCPQSSIPRLWTALPEQDGPSPCRAVAGRNSKSQPCSCLGQSHLCRPGLGRCPLPADLAPAPQQPAHPRGIHLPHLGLINRRVATSHCGFLLPLNALRPVYVLWELPNLFWTFCSPGALRDCGCDVGLMQRLTCFQLPFLCFSLQERISTQTNT